MIRDRAIVCRLNPANILSPGEYLARREALFADDEWYWSLARAEAWVFDSHLAAEEAAKARPYQDAEGHWHTPWALVVGNPQLDAARERRAANREAALDAAIPGIVAEPEFEKAGPPPRRTAPARRRREIDPAQVFAREEARHLA